MTPVEDRLAVAEAMIRDAAFSPVLELPAALSRIVAIVDNVRMAMQSAPPPNRGPIIVRLRSFQDRLLSFSAALRRSEIILQGYARHAGVSSNEYGPAGAAVASRDPAFVNLTI